MTDHELRRGRPRVFPQGTKAVTLSLPTDVANDLKRLGGSKWVRTMIVQTIDSHSSDKNIVLRLTNEEYERLMNLGGIPFLLKQLNNTPTD